MDAPSFCSVIIPTIGRDTLARAVASVLDQKFSAAEVEIVLVNDSAHPLPAAPWFQAPQVRLIQTKQRERAVARNAGAAVAHGLYFCFLDDDDWLLPNALEQFWRLAQEAPDAVWLYGGIQVVDNRGGLWGEENSGLSGNCLAQVMGGAWVPIQASLVRSAAFFTVGGYNPYIRGTEDQDLCRRLAAMGSFANTPATVACLYRGAGWQTTTDYGRAAEDTRLSRDGVVGQPGSFGRMLRSAGSAYWHGRVFHLYASLALWHFRQRRLSDGLSRALLGLTALLLSGRHAVSADFWRAFRADHVPGTLHFIEKRMAAG